MEPKAFTSLYSAEYEHPFDKRALDSLEKTPGIDLLSRKMMDAGLERFLRFKHTGNNIQIRKKNIPELYSILEKAAEILCLKELPELYIDLEDKITSFTSGEPQTRIVISSGATELLDEKELLFLFGREIGHIKSYHVLYHMMAESVVMVTDFVSDMSLGVSNFITKPIQIALLHWRRMSEFTADRAGLLCCQDPEVAAKALIKIAGLPETFHARIGMEELREQAKSFDDVQEKAMGKFIRFMAAHDENQPFTIIRASQLFQWIDSGDYERVLKRESLSELEENGSLHFICHSCGAHLEEDEVFCRMCGTRAIKE